LASVTPLTTTIGARIDGVDLRKPISDAAADVIVKALDEHGVIVFHGPLVGLEEQKALASLFGKMEAARAHQLAGDYDPVTVIDNDVYVRSGVKGRPPLPETFLFNEEFQMWHVDSCFGEKIPRAACLRAEILTTVGGGTCWASMGAAYDALSPTMQAWLDTLDIVYAPPAGYRRFVAVDEMSEENRAAWEAECHPRLHPMVVRHPETGRKQLFVNPVYAVKVDKLSNSESAMLLRYLYNHCFKPDFVYRHRWTLGDIVIWDELATAHLAPTDYGDAPRRMVRIYAGMVKPTAARDAGPRARRLEPVA
jgi:taurine dioxygenase